MEPEYVVWDDRPVRYRPGEAWAFTQEGAWERVHSAEVAHDGRVLTEEQFREMFGELPHLPTASFQSPDN